MKRVMQFVQDSVAEMKKVVWPSRDEVMASTKVIFVSVILFSLLLGVVDFFLLIGLDFLF